MSRKIWKATWWHKLASTPEQIKKDIQRLVDAEFDMLIPCVLQTSGIADYQSKIANVREEFKGWDPLMVAAEEANRLGLSIHAWNCVFPEGDESALLQNHPEFEAQPGTELERGEPIHKLACPNRPETQDYEASLYQELIDNYPVDGVSLDYIRFINGTCYCEYCQQDYKEKTGGDLMNLNFFKWNSVEAEDMDVWINWRCNVINRFVKRMREASKAGGKELSASVFHYYPGGLQDIAQDWESWVRNEWVDYILPMNYSPSSQIAAKWARNNIATLDGAPASVKHWQGINRPPAMTTSRYIDHVKAILDTGIEGITIFEYPCLTDTDLAELKKL